MHTLGSTLTTFPSSQQEYEVQQMPQQRSIKLDTQAVWLHTRTPQNFKNGRSIAEAQLISLRANKIGRQRKALRAALVQPCMPSADIRFSHQSTCEGSSHVFGGFCTPDAGAIASMKHCAQIQREDERQRRILNFSFIVGQGYSDPFQSTAVPLTAREHDVIRTVAAFTARAVFPAENRSRSLWQRQFDDYQQRSLHDYFSDEAGLQALICYGWSVMSRLNEAERDTCLARALEHGAKAVEALGPIIAKINQGNGQLENALPTVQLHCIIALFTGDRKAIVYHQDALRKLVLLVGGLDKLSPLRKYKIVHLVVRIAQTTRTRTAIDPSDWDPDSLPVHANGTMITRTSQTGPWVAIFTSLRELASVEKVANQNIDLIHWCFLRRHAIKGQVANMWCDFTEPKNAVELVPGSDAIPTTVYQASPDICLCLAVQLYIILTYEPITLSEQTISSAQIFYIMLIRCIDKLEQDLQESSRESDLLWVLNVGTVAEMHMSSRAERSVPWVNTDSEDLGMSWLTMRFGLLALRLGGKTVD